jgi:hypothetical protein
MNRRLPNLLATAVAVAVLAMPTTTRAQSPRNPYSGFNLSGINYGAMQWERAQQQGRRVWPYYNTPSRGSSRGTMVTGGTVVGGGGAVMTGRSAPRGLFGRRR